MSHPFEDCCERSSERKTILSTRRSQAGGERSTGRDHLRASSSVDLGLPDRNGLDLLHQLRDEGLEVPVVILSSRTDEAGIVQALELGADDYVTKPFSMNELIARVRVAIRHRLQQQGERPVFKVGDLLVDLVRRIVRVRGEEVRLSPREYEILRVLVQHAGKVLTHQFIIREVWGNMADCRICGSISGKCVKRSSRTPSNHST